MIKYYLLFLLINTVVIAGNSDIVINKVFDADAPGRYKHPASITQLANGDLYLSYFGGSGEYNDDTAIYGSRLRMGDTKWSSPEIIADTPDRGEGNPVVWLAPDGRVWLFYVNRYGETWSTARVKVKLSDDGAEHWSDSFILNFNEGTMVRGQPIVLFNGDYLLPMYHETGGDREQTGASTSSFFMRFNPKTKEWTETNKILSSMGNLQPQVVQLSDKYLIAYIRRAGHYGPTENGYLLRAESHDGGYTWANATETEFPNPNAAVDFIKLRNGHLLLVYNNSMSRRTPLTVAISIDGDKSYPYHRNIAEGDNTFAYPYAIQTHDGKIHVVYTTNGRTTIMHAVFDEQAILGWKNKLLK